LGVQGSQEYIQEYLIHRDGATVWSENDIGKMFIVSTLMSYRWIFLGHWVLEPAVGSGIWFLESGAKTYSGMVTAGSTDLLGTVELKTGVIF
jgi:hypothetical protein